MIDGIDVVFIAGQVVGLILGLLLLVWIGHKIDNKIRGKDNKRKPPTPPATHDHTN